LGEDGCKHLTTIMETNESSTPSVLIGENEPNQIEIDSQLAIGYAVIGCVGMAGNLFVVLVIFKFKLLRSFFITTTSLIRDKDSIPSGLQQELFCRLWLTNLPVWSMFVSSTYNLLMVTFERYFAIVHPLKFSWRITRQRAYILMAIAWIAGVAYNTAYMVPTSYITEQGNCSVYALWPSKFVRSAHGVLTVIIQFFIPIISITGANYYIATALQTQFKRCEGDGTAAMQRRLRIMRARNNTVKTLVLVFVCFVLCWVWNQVYYLLFNLGSPGIQLKGAFYHFSVIAVFCNSCINPVVYMVKYEKFQQAVCTMCCCRRTNAETIVHSPGADSPQPITRIMHSPPEGQANHAFIMSDFHEV
jgi:hypothetical protein